jgi:hypothetical protein
MRHPQLVKVYRQDKTLGRSRGHRGAQTATTNFLDPPDLASISASFEPNGPTVFSASVKTPEIDEIKSQIGFFFWS